VGIYKGYKIMGTYTSGIEKHKSLIATKMWAIRSVIVTGLIISYASLLQTISSFSEWADPTIPLIGMYLPLVMGIFFQYGQTAALYMKERFGNDIPIYNLTWFTSNNIWVAVFVFCGVIDASSNIIWFEKNVAPKVQDKIVLYRIMAYPLLILTVMVEEGVAWMSEGHRKITAEYRSLCESEKRIKSTPQPDSRNLQSRQPETYRNNSGNTSYSQGRDGVPLRNEGGKKPSFIPQENRFVNRNDKPEPTYHPKDMSQNRSPAGGAGDTDIEKFIAGLGA